MLAKKKKPDIICISELGNYRKVQGFPHYDCTDIGTQSAVFWRDGLKVNKTTLKLDDHPRILTQCVNINLELLLVHTYIAPDVTNYDRNEYWKTFLKKVDEWCIENSVEKIIVTGDLNTRDKRFGSNHTENHNYLDELLLSMHLVNDKNIPTRENNTLDITLANNEAFEKITKH
jgi:exonuclease III